MKEGEQLLRKKTRRKGIMVSDFVTARVRLEVPTWLPVDDLPSFV